jgi:hypothetical protein
MIIIKKVEEFMTNNHYEKLPNEITNKRQNIIRTHVNYYNNIINRNLKWKYINMNPSTYTSNRQLD